MSYFIKKQLIKNLRPLYHRGNLGPVRNCLKRLIEEAWNGKDTDLILLFGFAGSGKSALIESVGHDLCSVNASGEIITVDCRQLVTTQFTARPIVDRLGRLEEEIFHASQRARVLLLDEFEAVSPGRAANSPDRALSYWSMGFPGQLKDCQSLVVLFVTNYPNLVEQATRSRIPKTLYLPCPDDDAIEGVIASFVDGKDVRAIRREVVRICDNNNLRAVVRGLASGLRYAERIGHIKNRAPAIDVNMVAIAVIAGSGFPPVAEVDKYESDYQAFRALSDLLLQSCS